MKNYKIAYRDGYKYQLAEDYFIQIEIKNKNIITDYITLTENGMLCILQGYAWDGASGLTIDTKSSMRGSLVHDVLYQLMRLKLINKRYRKYADELLRDICVEDGMWHWRAWMWYKAVRNFAGFAADPKNKKKIIYV